MQSGHWWYRQPLPYALRKWRSQLSKTGLLEQ
jgi:hypothetical protein